MDCRGWWSHLCAGKSLFGTAKVGKVKKTKEIPSPFLSGEEGGEFFFRGLLQLARAMEILNP
jgi:hypothetical protein